jgi:Mrp family chromosome partitioning ATPase/capsular polysaccharide biosynthesis protein
MTLPAQTQTQPPSPPPQDTVDVRAYLRPIWRRKWLVIAITLLAGVGTYLVSSHQTKRYVAQTQLYVQTANPVQVVQGQAALGPSAQTLSDNATQIESVQSQQAAARALGIPATASNTVVATPGTNSSFITITVTSNSPTVAADLANKYASQFLATQASAVVAEARNLRTESEVTLATLPPHDPSYATERVTIAQQIQNFDAIIRNPSGVIGARQYNTAVAPAAPSSPKPKRDAIFGLIVGFVVAIAVVFILELLDRRLILVSTLESLYSRTVLSVLPHASDPAPTTDGHLSTAPELIEAMRTLLVNIGIEAKELPARSLLITSAMPGEGKSTVSRGLALAYVEAGKRVLVIDADLRRPIMNATFGLAAAPGLAQVLAGEASLADAVRTVVVSPPSAAHPSVAAESNGKPETSSNGNHREAGVLHVLTHGERVDNPATLLASPAWQTTIDEAASTYDVTIVDSAPILTIADSIPLIDHVDMVLLVTRLGMTTRESASRIVALFRRVPDAHLVGLVANDMRDQFLDEGYAYYRYGYGYGQKGDGKRRGIRKYTRV